MAATMPMTVVQLASMDERQALIAEWQAAGLGHAKAELLEEEMLAEDSAPSRWHAVVDNNSGMTIAIFDVRSVPLQSPDYHKSLHIHFTPELDPLDWENRGESTEGVDAIIKKSVSAMSMAFDHLVAEAELTNEHKVKIYCAHPFSFSIFRHFARELILEDPTRYSAFFYKKWVEITHLQGGRHDSGSL